MPAITAPGTYRARVVSSSVCESSTGKPYVRLWFDGTSGSIASDFWLTDAAAERTIKALRACGWSGNDLENLVGLGAWDVEIVVEAEEYKGKQQLKVRYVNSIAEIHPEARRELAEKFRSIAAGVPLVKGPAASSTDDAPDAL